MYHFLNALFAHLCTLVLKLNGCRYINSTVDFTLHRGINCFHLYFVKCPPHGQMFQIKFVDLSYVPSLFPSAHFNLLTYSCVVHKFSKAVLFILLRSLFGYT
jgi:hypothetical protein